MLANPDKVRAGIEAMIEQERESAYRDPNRESRAWQEKLAEADRMRSNYQEMAAKGFMTLNELRTRAQPLQGSLETLQRRGEHLKELEQDKDTLMKSFAGIVSEALNALSPEERHQVTGYTRC